MAVAEAALAPTLISPRKWDEVVRAMRWRQGDHVVLIGPTGSGKTELLVRLLESRRYAIFLGTKKRDETQSRLRRMGYKTIPNAEQIEPEIWHRIILRPPFPKVSAQELKAFHREAFRAGLMRAFRQENWTVAIDEARYICDFLGLTDEVNTIMLQGRSQGNTVVAGTQRPVWIPRELVDMATHVFIWKPNTHGDLQRITEIVGGNKELVHDAFSQMDHHDVLYIHQHEPDKKYLTNTRW